MNKKKVLTTGAACGLIAAMAIGGTMAYLTDSEQTSNTFTVGKVKIDLEENPVGTQRITTIMMSQTRRKQWFQIQELDKNPQVENTGSNKPLYL